MASFPTTVEEITPKWLTGALHDAGVLPTGSVTGVEAETIAIGQGFVGSLARLTITYADGGLEPPGSVIAKFPSLHQETKERVIQMGIYEREVKFYQELAGAIPMRTPRCYFSGLDENTGEFLLLLEDLGSLRAGDQVVGLSAADTLVSLNHLASLHAAKWNDVSLGQFPWLPRYDVGADVTEARFETNWSALQDIQLFHLSDDAIALGHRLVGKVQDVKEYLTRPPITLLHGDFRIDNLLFGEPGSTDELVVLDWQLSRIGKPSWDIAYFTSRLAPEPRTKAISLYHEALTEYGVSDYTFEQCLHDCRWAALDVFIFMVNVSMSLDFSSPRGKTLLNEWIPNAIEMATQFGGEILP